MGTDRPGRVQPALGTARSALEQSDFHDAAEREFLKNVAERLDGEVKGGSVRRMVIVAPPRALGVLRDAFTRAVSAAVRREIRKDWVKRPIWEIERGVMAEAAEP
jgi:protein required for attachment to host cells